MFGKNYCIQLSSLSTVMVTTLVCSGFWSILVLSVSIGGICCVFSWTLTCIDSREGSAGLALSMTQDKCGYSDVYQHILIIHTVYKNIIQHSSKPTAYDALVKNLTHLDVVCVFPVENHLSMTPTWTWVLLS